MSIKSTYLKLSITQSIGISSFGTSSGLKSILPALVSFIATGGAIIAFAGSPGEFQPIFAVGAGGLSAVVVLALGSRLFRNPAKIVWLPPLIILAGAAGGTLVVAGQAEIDPLLLLGNVQALGAAAAALRFLLGLVVIALLAIVCSSPGWSHALAVFSISGPSLLLFFSLRNGIDMNLSGVLAGKMQWFMLLGEITFIGVSAYLIFRWQLLERCHARLGQLWVSSALTLDSPSLVNKALSLIDGWIDPFGLVENALFLQEAGDNQDRLTEAHTILKQKTKVLNRRTRSRLSSKASERLEMQLLLAEDELIRQQVPAAASRITELARDMLGDPEPSWIADEALKIFGSRALSIPVLADALVAVELAVEATSILELNGEEVDFNAKLSGFFANVGGKLPEAIRAKLENGPQSWHKSQLMLAEDDFRCGRSIEGLIRLARILASDNQTIRWFPPVVVDAWAKYSKGANPVVQESLWEICQSERGKGIPADQTLAILILENGIGPELAERLDGEKMDASGDPAGAGTFLTVCDELYRGNLIADLPNFITGLSRVPHGLKRHKFLPRLAELAESKVNRLLTFFHEDPRPQLMEILEAPPTWLYGGRIAYWTFLSADNKKVFFATTGHGPAQICTRVSAALNALAHERNCSSDLIFAGASFFDLRNSPTSSGKILGETDLKAKAIDFVEHIHEFNSVNRGADQFLAHILNYSDQDIDAFVATLCKSPEEISDFKNNIRKLVHQDQRIFKYVANKTASPTIEKTLISLQQIDAEMGLLEHHDVEEACWGPVREGGLTSESPEAPEKPFPILLPYVVNGKPLRIKLPFLCFGAEEYEEVAEEYRLTALTEIRQEYIRRIQFHKEAWKGFASQYHWLSKKSETALKRGEILIGFEIDDITLTKKRLDRPVPMSEYDYFAKLPTWILSELSYWAWADYNLHLLPEASDFKPHWQQTLLVDAFLRNFPLKSDNPKLDAIHEKWQQNFRPLVLVMLDECLRSEGMTLADIAQENTVFRVVEQDGTSLVLEPSQIWDARNDPAPWKQSGKTVFAPHFGSRRRITVPALEAQKEAIKVLDWSLIEPIQLAGLQKSLKLDSGAALDKLVAIACEGLNRPVGLADDMARVLDQAKRKPVPLKVDDCFQGWDRICYDLAEGDAALALALTIGQHRHLQGEGGLRELIDSLSTCKVQKPFSALDQFSSDLVQDLDKFLSKSDLVTLNFFAEKRISEAYSVLLDKSEECYSHAMKIDSQSGCACLSLARLKWQSGRFREALTQLFGPVPKANLEACQFPLSVGVKIAGGQLSIKTYDSKATWHGAKGLSFEVTFEESGKLKLRVPDVGYCRISGLASKDIKLLEEFFGKFDPASCYSLGNKSFREWLSLLQIPGLGKRGALATALADDNTGLSVLAACLYLTPPDVLVLPPGKFRGRFEDLTSEEVVTSLEWGPR